jgi:hypothetical protein
MVELRTVSADLEAIPSTITEFSRRLERAFRSILPRA